MQCGSELVLLPAEQRCVYFVLQMLAQKSGNIINMSSVASSIKGTSVFLVVGGGGLSSHTRAHTQRDTFMSHVF